MEYRAIFFDLDGTLLPLDMDHFMKDYFMRLRKFVQERGYDGELFSQALNLGMRAMGSDHGTRTNRDAFWEAFAPAFGQPTDGMEELLMEFYENDFGLIGAGMPQNPAARCSVERLKTKGYPLYLATMPMFPRSAVEWRLKWAGVDPACFERITLYDNSFSLKPALSYYCQNIDIAGCAPEHVLMVGNNTREDLAILELGADAFLVTDCLIDPVGFPFDTVKHGTLEEFADWAESLPACGRYEGEDA